MGVAVAIHDDDIPRPRVPNEDIAPPPPGEGRHLHAVRADGRIPPHDFAAERALLGAELLSADSRTAAAVLAPEDFYRPAHGHLHAALQQLHADGAQIDKVTLAHYIPPWVLEQLGGAAEINSLMVDCPATSNTASYAAIIRTTSLARQRISTLGEAVEHLYAGDADRALEHLRRVDHDQLVGTITFEDVAAAVRGDVEDVRPTMLRRNDGQALIYPGLTHWLMGEPGKGKTWVALHAAAEQLHTGRTVLYLDWEGNRRIVGARLRSLGVTADQVEAGLLYFRPPTITTQLTSQLVAAATEHACTLVVGDGVAKAIARQGLNEDKAPDVLAWLEMLVNPLAETGAAVLLLDHVIKERDGRGLWARGSGAKIGEVSGAAWVVKPRETFSRHRGGRIDLIQAKDREGYVGTDGAAVALIHFQPQPDTGQLIITVKAPADADPDTGFRPTVLMERVSRTVELLNIEGVRPSGNQIDKDVSGNRKAVSEALRILVEEGYIKRSPGARGALEHTVLNQYREANDPKSDRFEPPQEPPEDYEQETF